MNRSPAVPTYKLYGEQDAWPAADMVHWESIAARSRLHNWHINPHRHVGLFQLLCLGLMIYAIVYAVLLAFLRYDRFAVDALRTGTRASRR